MSGARVLVVEDDSLIATDICQSLESNGYVPIGPVSSGAEALAKAKETQPDVVLMDIVLKGPIDGISAAAQISDSLDIPVIFLTGHTDRPTLERAKITEPSGYIIKPFDESQVNAAIEITLYNNRTNSRKLGTLPRSSNGAKSDSGQDSEGFLRTLDFFSELEAAELKLFSNACAVRKLKEGELVFDSASEEMPVFIVRSGRIAIIESARGGKQLTVELLPPGDLYGLITAVAKTSGGLTVRAERASELLVLPRRTFLLILESHPQISLRFAQYIAERLRNSQSLAKAMAYDDVYSRISSVVSTMFTRFGTWDKDLDSYVLDLTRRELASLTGTTVETVVRVLKSMERAGIIKLGRRKCIVVREPSKLDLRPHQNTAAGNAVNN